MHVLCSQMLAWPWVRLLNRKQGNVQTFELYSCLFCTNMSPWDDPASAEDSQCDEQHRQCLHDQGTVTLVIRDRPAMPVEKTSERGICVPKICGCHQY